MSKLPGINSKNIYGILNQVENLLDLLELSEEKLSEILGSKQNAADLYGALHGEIDLPSTDQNKQEQKRSPESRHFEHTFDFILSLVENDH